MASRSFVTTVKDAVIAGPLGEEQLVAMLASASAADKVTVVAALGDAQGEAGVPALRNLLATPQRSVDLRCAALLALAKRAGVAASDVLAEHLTGTPVAVADYAVIGLAGVGDDRAWSQVHARLQQQLDRPPPATRFLKVTPGLRQFEVLITLAYLVRHLGESPTDRVAQLAVTLRSRFDRLHTVEQDWLGERWPGIAPGGPLPEQIAAPDPAPFISFVHATHLFGPVH